MPLGGAVEDSLLTPDGGGDGVGIQGGRARVNGRIIAQANRSKHTRTIVFVRNHWKQYRAGKKSCNKNQNVQGKQGL